MRHKSLLFLLVFTLLPFPGRSQPLFERRSWSETQQSIEAVFHLTRHPEGRVEIEARWMALDGAPLELLAYALKGPDGRVLAAGEKSPADKPLLERVQILDRSPATKASDTADWSVKEHGLIAETTEESKGLGWKIPLGNLSDPGDPGTNEEALKAVFCSIAFDLPDRGAGLKGYNLECVLAKGHKTLRLVYRLHN